jgi:hypothetical protein
VTRLAGIIEVAADFEEGVRIALCDRWWLVIAAALYPSRAERVTGMAPLFVLRFSVPPLWAVASAISVAVVIQVAI